MGVRERFMSKVLVTFPRGCWEWQGSIRPNGYGRFGVKRKIVYAHRFAYELFNGPIPDNMTIDHLCRVRRCVNPRHLEAVAFRTNVMRGVSPPAQNARKTHCNRGHEYEPGNTYQWRGTRSCLKCRRDREKARWQQMREAKCLLS